MILRMIARTSVNVKCKSVEAGGEKNFIVLFSSRLEIHNRDNLFCLPLSFSRKLFSEKKKLIEKKIIAATIFSQLLYKFLEMTLLS